MRSTAVAFATQYSTPRKTYTPDQLQSVQGFLHIMIDVGLIDSSVFFSYLDSNDFAEAPPSTISDSNNPTKLNEEILNFPIGYTFAVYPDLSGPTSMTPLLWTRGLHRFREFKEPYGGLIAFMDGHVQYYSDDDESELAALFESPGPASTAIRLLEHVPEDWVETAPLPVQMEAAKKNTFADYFWPLLIYFGPALIGGFLITISSNREYPRYRRILRGAVAFTIILLATAIFFPCIYCCW
ncbi:MAG: hypothetical protein ACSHX8_12805 [Opitutaceae bacterium]